MKQAGIYLALQLAALAVSAPLQLHKHHDVAITRTRWRTGRPEVPSVLIFSDNKGWKEQPPRGMLAAEKPLDTEILLLSQSNSPVPTRAEETHYPDSSLAPTKPDEPPYPDSSLAPTKPEELHHPDEAEAGELLDISEMEIAIAMPSPLGTPCRYARLSQDRDDVMVLGLAVAFLFVVIVLETWGAFWSSLQSALGYQGAIRLEGVDESEDARKEPLSIQAWSEDDEPVLDEKR